MNKKTKDITLDVLTKEEFEALPVLQQRVLIAKDVIANIKSKKFNPARGVYFSTSRLDLQGFKHSGDNNDVDAKTYIKSNDCFVCAKGAAVCSYVQKFNSIKVSQLSDELAPVVRIFGHRLWSEIEAQFEGSPTYRKDENGNSFPWRLSIFTSIKPKSIVSIMQNIIDNNGYFKYRGKLIG